MSVSQVRTAHGSSLHGGNRQVATAKATSTSKRILENGSIRRLSAIPDDSMQDNQTPYLSLPWVPKNSRKLSVGDLVTKSWHLEDYENSYTSICGRLWTNRRDTVVAKLCTLEMERAIPRNLHTKSGRVVLIDTSGAKRRYYSSRDGRAWQIVLDTAGFKSRVAYRIPALSDWDVQLCLGISSQDSRCMPEPRYTKLKPHQRVNYIAGMRNILWKKDSFCRSMRVAREMLTRSSKYSPEWISKLFSFSIPCFILPEDAQLLRSYASETDNSSLSWIVKPINHGEGHGLFVASSIAEVESTNNEYLTRSDRLVQPFMNDPFLINNKKFDMRCYVLVTSISPLRAYMYGEGLVRFAASNYTKNATKTGRKDKYLTNTSINKLFAALSKLTWTFQKLKDWFDNNGTDSTKLFRKIHRAIASALVMSEPTFRNYFDKTFHQGYSCENCFQILGVDVIFNSDLEPKIIEINGLPSMQLSHNQSDSLDPRNQYTLSKLMLLTDTLRMVLRPQSVAEHIAHVLNDAKIGLKPGKLCDTRIHRFCLNIQDLKVLSVMEQEAQNLGFYERIYPTTESISGPLADAVIEMDVYMKSSSNLTYYSTLNETFQDSIQTSHSVNLMLKNLLGG